MSCWIKFKAGGVFTNSCSVKFLIALCVVLMASSCKDEKCGGSRDIYIYKFDLPVSITPARSTYRVGDTITVEVNIPKMIVDKGHDVVEVIKAQNIFHASWVRKVNGEFSNINATEYVEYLSDEHVVGSFQIVSSSTSSYLRGVYGAPVSEEFVSSSKYRFVLKQAGVFWFTFSGQRTANEEDGPLLSIANMCPNGSIHYKYEVNGGAGNNFAILCQTEDVFCTPVYADDNRGRAFDDRAGYVFKVTE